MEKLINKTYFIFGLGISGISSVKYLSEKGCKVFVWDDNKLSRDTIVSKAYNNVAIINPDECNFETDIDYLVLSPGIPLTNPKPHYIVKKVEGKCPIISDIELFYKSNNKAKFIGITGTNGKSTITSLIGHIIKESHVGGNIGIPVLDLPENNQSNTTYVLEMSSYGLDLIKDTKFNIAVWSNISPDHLDRHGNMSGYVKSKMKIFKNQNHNDISIISIDDQESLKVFNHLKKFSKSKLISVSCINEKANIYIQNNCIYDNIGNKKIDLDKLPNLQGVHNQQNIALAYAVAISNDISTNEIVSSIKSFEGLPHRMQYLGSIENVSYINDSKATNANSTYYALEAFKNIYWILGGVTKEGGINSLTPFFKNIKKAYLIGQSTKEFAETLSKHNVDYKICDNIGNAFKLSNSDALSNKKVKPVILLSPACASFDQFKNFEERGDAFSTLVVNEILRNNC